MYVYKDIDGLTRAAVIALWLYMITKFLIGFGALYNAVLMDPPSAGGLAAVGLIALLGTVVLLICVVLIACWVYRASANAHVIGGGLSISAGWAVGWYFVPIANLFQPYLAMKETWLASHYGSNWAQGEATGLIGWWWGLWLLGGVIGYAAMFTHQADPALSAQCNFALGLEQVAASLILIRIMTQIRDAQKVTRHTEVFA